MFMYVLPVTEFEKRVLLVQNVKTCYELVKFACYIENL